ncbi:MAG: biotin transporter BioY, partial [Actinomycetales bacterium]
MTSPSNNDVQRWTLLDRLPAGLWWRLLAVLVGAALVSMGAQITTPSGGEVPGTFQTLAVLVVGALLGPVFGTASVALYVLLGGLGAPIFANGGSGFGGPTSGYFIGFIIAALVVG